MNMLDKKWEGIKVSELQRALMEQKRQLDNDDEREFHSFDEFKEAFLPNQYKREKEQAEREKYYGKDFGKRLAEDFFEKMRKSLEDEEFVDLIKSVVSAKPLDKEPSQQEKSKEREREKDCPEDFMEVKKDG